MAPRDGFSSKLGFILAAAGSAVGLGNLAAFPVGVTKNGGAAFLLLYIIFVAFICYPIMIAELAMGRSAKKNPVGAFKDLSGKSPIWSNLGGLAVITPFMIAVFYLVLTVWLMGYFVQTVMGNLNHLAEEATFSSFIGDPSIFIYTVLVVIIIVLILHGGVKNGIEKTAKILMPALVFMLVALVIFVLTLDNAILGIKFYLIPDLSKINGGVVAGAMSQAFFSLSLGMGIMITYGSYLRKDDNIVESARLVAIADTSIAFFSGLLILPAIFSFNPTITGDQLSDSSVGLIYNFLPKVFMSMEASVGYFGASVVAAVFFLAVFFAAITSLVSIMEVPVAYFVDDRKFSRNKSLKTVVILLVIFGTLATASFGMVNFLSDMPTYGGAATKSFFDYIFDMFYDTILPLIGFIVCVFTVYKWKTGNFNQELANGSPNYKGSFLEKYLKISLGTYIPLFVFFVFITAVLKVYFGVDIIALLSN